MNGQRKFHKPTGPAFNAGEVWVDLGNSPVKVVSVRKYSGATSDYISDYGVTYEWTEKGKLVHHEKDCWNFQVRYCHVADLYV